MTRTLVLSIVLIAAASADVASGADTPAPRSAQTTDLRTSAMYTQRATSRCLTARGYRVMPVKKTDPGRLRFAQLAQRNSFEVRLKAGFVGLAFERSVVEAMFLLDSLRARDRYSLRRVRNVVLMVDANGRRHVPAIVACLR